MRLFVTHSRNAPFFILPNSARPIRFAVGLPHRERDENKENARPKDTATKDDDSDDGEGPVLYREDEGVDDASKFFENSLFLKFELENDSVLF